TGQGGAPAGPFPGTFDQGDRSRENGFVAQPAFKVLCQRLSRTVSAARILLQALQANRLEVTVATLVDGAEWGGLLVGDFPERFQRCVRPEGRCPCDCFVQNYSEAVNIRGGACLPRSGRDLFRGHVSGC